MTGNRHALRIAVIWLVLTVVGMVLVATVLAPHLPPGGASTEAPWLTGLTGA